MFDMKASNKSLMVIRLRGALIRKGYRMRAHNLLKQTLAELKVLVAKKNAVPAVYTKRVSFYLALAVRTLRPMFEVKVKKVAAQKLKLPAYLREERAEAYALRWLIEAAESNMQKDIGQALAHEIIDACNLKGVAYKKKLDLYKEVDASQLYLKYIH